MTDVTIVGGGLAGMAAAYRLLERGCTVAIYEAGDRLGGKAGASIIDGVYEDHGYHIFPTWYLNIWQLIHELCIEDNFIPLEVYYQLRAGQFPHFNMLKDIGSVHTARELITSGIMPVPEMILLAYTVLDLLCHSFTKSNFLDETTVIGFIQSRFYRNNDVVNELREMILKASSAPGYRFGARTLQRVLNNEMMYSTPMFHITLNSLQESFITPIQQRLETFPGCTIHLNHRLTQIVPQDGRVAELVFSNGETIRQPVERVLITIPHEDLSAVLDAPMFQADPHLFDIRYLYSAEMSALTIYTRQPIPELPKEHVILTFSEFGLSFIDIGQTRPGFQGKTVLNVISADFTPLVGLPDDVIEKALLKELRKFIPLEESNIERLVLQPHYQQPLFLNDAGVWKYRPHSGRSKGLTNLYIAGDYCRSAIDLATMEGAVSSGLLAAEDLRKDAGLPHPITVQAPRRAPKLPLVILKYVLMPFIALVKLYTVLVPRSKR